MMFKTIRLVALISLICVVSLVYAQPHPAELRIDNKTTRNMEIKVMKEIGNKAVKVSDDSVSAGTKKTIFISDTGDYYLKVKAVYPGREPAYSKGNPFKCYVGSDRYSVLTVSYSMKESESQLDPLSGNKINKSDFEKDRD